MNLASSLGNIKGVGEKTKQQFAQAGINTVGDLIDFLPRTYQDYVNVQKINNIKPGLVTVEAVCESVSTRQVRRGMAVTTAVLSDGSGKVQATWFNQRYREKQLKEGQKMAFSGKYEFRYNRYQITNPSVEKAEFDPIQGGRFLPIYRSIKDLKPSLVRKVINEVKPLISFLPETLPEFIVANEKLLSYSEAVKKMHFPEDISDVEKAKERLAFEELFQLLLASQYNRIENTKLKGKKVPFSQITVKQFVEKLPFKLTDAQRLAAWEIIQDLEQPHPMNRLLQGDVGAGKTVVAGLVAAQVASHKRQTAIMAPTEILATQHAEELDKMLSLFGFKIGLLTGGLKTATKKELLEKIKDGKVDVVIGTHALIQQKVEFNDLALAIVDEQHRFGVEQRQKLLAKGKIMPHMLAMTATPIPRSLALTLYGELDISIINQLPAGRKPIKTKVVSPNSVRPIYEHIDAEIGQGRQAYVICSLIDENPDNDLKSVELEYKKLRNSIFKHRNIGLLHGKMSQSDKNKAMQDFADGKIDILVSTTVVEVGVSVANATVIVIENADRFGLSQLHQLRGRVGRSNYQSYCYLINSTSAKPTKRLLELEKSNDGFYLAEADLELRGPGEIYGKSQHGVLDLRVASLADTKMIKRASAQAKCFIQSGVNVLEYRQLAAQVERYQRITTLN